MAENHDQVVGWLREKKAEADRYQDALSKIAAGPSDAPYAEPWSRAAALIALGRPNAP